MFHTGRDCAACQLLIFSTMKIESSLGKRQARKIRHALKWEGIYALFQNNFAAINKDTPDRVRLAAILWTEKPFLWKAINAMTFLQGIQQESTQNIL